MAVKAKKTERKPENETFINFNKADYKAVEGIAPFFPGKTKVLHKVLADKLIALKRAKQVKIELDENKSKYRSVMDVDTK
jgi:hypothetical protein